MRESEEKKDLLLNIFYAPAFSISFDKILSLCAYIRQHPVSLIRAMEYYEVFEVTSKPFALFF